MKFFALNLLLVGIAVANPVIDPVHHESNLFEARSAPGIIQPDYHFVNFDEPQVFFSHHDEYGVPHEDYGIPEVKHEEYGPPLERIAPTTTEHYCPEEDFQQEFLRVPPAAPEIEPLPIVPEVKGFEDYGLPKIHEEYGVVPEVKHEEYGPPPPLCPNFAPDVSYPFCCENGATNPYCCLGEWINPTCSEPTTLPPPTEAPKLAPYPPKKLCQNYADDSTYPYCCENGASNEYCCLGQWINPTCSEPTTTTPAPLCPNFAPDASYPFCCENGATNPYCCVGEWINPTCSEPTTTTTTTLPPPTEAPKLAPYPPKKLCQNYADDSTYPYCCENGASNEYCCLGQWINPTCSEPTTTTPAPLCPNFAPDASYPFCCENGATNPYCCVGEWINPTCSEPTTTTLPPPTEAPKLAPYPPKRLCFNGADDSTYPYCCVNGAQNEYCCAGEWVNPTCSPPPTTTTTPPPVIVKSPYPAKVISHYEKGVDFHTGGSFVKAQVTAESSSGVIGHQSSVGTGTGVNIHTGVSQVNAAASANVDHHGISGSEAGQHVRTSIGAGVIGSSNKITIPIPSIRLVKPVIAFNKQVRFVRAPKKILKGFIKLLG